MEVFWNFLFGKEENSPTEIPLPNVGDKIGRFTIKRLLGQGGTGSVFLAYDDLLNVDVALKVLNPLYSKGEMAERFRREVLLARRITHPGICRLFDFHQEGNLFFISMEYIEGQTLHLLINKTGVLLVKEAGEIINRTAVALGAAHRLGVIHRDLKTTNIMVRMKKQVSILDFGFARGPDMSRITSAGFSVGTINYMAPEVVKGEVATKKSDIYSLGVIFYKALTGRLPYKTDNPHDLLFKQKERDLVPPHFFNQEISEELEKVILKAMAIDPRDRYHSVDDFGQAIVAVLGEEIEVSPEEASSVAPWHGDIEKSVAQAIQDPTYSKILQTRTQDTTVLFSDIVGITSYFDRYGDIAGVKKIQAHNDLVFRMIRRFRGQVIKTIGDAVMSCFDSPDNGVETAIEIQRELAQYNLGVRDKNEKILLRMGLHSGKSIFENQDLFGNAVNVAARICSEAKASQILISSVTRDMLNRYRERTVFQATKKLKGKTEAYHLYFIHWDDSPEASATSPDVSGLAEGPSPVFQKQEPMAEESGPLSPGSPTLLTTGTQIDRYTLLAKLGEGGMGQVYSAYDPQLDRKIALKLVHAGLQTADQSFTHRLLQEAKATAQISHPNVVTVYDAGFWEGRVFISMEFVEGQGLDDWLKEKRHDWREVLSVFREAGKGLAAAHLKGLLHRDFKPSNVIIGRDGRVRVIDFGLAKRARMSEEAREAQENAPFDTTPLDLRSRVVELPRDVSADDRLTMPGVLVGTPAYMSPEQHSMQEPDARSDQYNFCASLYDALYGEFAFQGGTLEEIHQNKISGKVLAAPSGSSVPGWLRLIVLKGLAPKPEERHASMDELLEKLSYDPQKFRRRIVMVAGVIFLMGLGAFGYAYSRMQKEGLCHKGNEQISRVWGEEAQRELKEKFLSIQVPYAEDSWLQVKKRLDDYARKWSAQVDENCAATQLRREQTEQMHDLRLSCLNRRLSGVNSLLGVFQSLDVKLLERSVEAVNSLDALESCANADALMQEFMGLGIPKDPERVEKIRKEIDRLKALDAAGKFEEGLQLAAQLKQESQQLGYAPLDSEVLYSSGKIQNSAGRYKEAYPSFQQAFLSAIESRYERMAAKAYIEQLTLVGIQQEGKEDWRVIRKTAEALLKNREGTTSERVQLLINSGWVWMELGRYEDADLDFHEAISMLNQQKEPDPVLVAETNNAIGVSLLNQSKYKESEEYFEKALQMRINLFGLNHHKVAAVINNLGGAEFLSGDYQKALDNYEKALEIQLKIYGRQHQESGYSVMNIGTVLAYMGQTQQGIARLNEALEIFKQIRVGEHMDISSTLLNLGEAYQLQRDCGQAKKYFEQAKTMTEKLQGGNNIEIAMVSVGLGFCESKLGHHSQAFALLEESRKIFAQMEGEKSFDTAQAMGYFAISNLRAGNRKAGFSWLERTRNILTSLDNDEDTNLDWMGNLYFELANAVCQRKGDKKLGLELAEKSLSCYQKASYPQALKQARVRELITICNN